MVEEGGPAAQAGMQPGDIVLSLNDEPIQNSADLARIVAGTKPGTTITAEVWRKGRSVPLTVTTTELTTPDAVASGGDANAKSAAKAGLSVIEIPADQRRALKIDNGVLVQDTQGNAARAGIRPGDIILSVNDVPVKGVSHLESLIQESAGKTLVLFVRRGADTMFVPLKLG